jgi:Tol biopolymer transport system component/predicted Ser/Thr protein kinase
VTLAAGSRLGPYEILAPIGAGGMGEVYRARDTRLERTVAIKVLPDHLSNDEDVRRRFEREAKTISRLSHPHICALYDVGNQDGVEYLVMEYLEGETLADRLAKAPLPLEQTLRYGVEIAGALDKAHREGIVHRDLKPGNVMLTKSGVKLLDFGLAKALEPEPPVESVTSAPTALKDVTREGAILGTLSYMAPEQLEGKKADPRTDIFALGATLYEMATGRKAFTGESQASVISSILTQEPQPIAAIAPMTPPALDRVVKACLAKDPEDRWQSAADVAKELKWIAEGSAAGPAAAAADSGSRKRRERAAWAIAAVAILLGALSTYLFRRPQAPDELTRFTILPPSGESFLPIIGLSPDARRIAFLLQDEGGRNAIGVRSLDSLEMRRLAGTEDARGIIWSPDGREIAFFSEGRLKRIGADGGPVQTICESGAAFSGAWSRQGTILFTKEFGAPIVAVPATGGTPRPVTAPDPARGEAHFHPAFLPDGRHFVFVARDIDPEKTSVMLASLDSKEVRRLFHADSSAVFADPGYLLFARDNALFAWKFDPRSLKLVAEPVPALEQVHYGTEDNILSLSAAGNRVAYLPWLMRRRLVWVDRKGRDLGALGEIGGYEDVRISPNGGRVAVTRRDPSHGQNQDVWVLDAARGTGSRITAERTDEFDPAWFPDGERLAYVSDHAGFYDLYERPASGGPEKILARSKQDKILPSVSPDGRHLLASVPEAGNYTRVWIPLSGGGDALRLTGDSRFSEEHPEISPDGRWTAFDSSESGQREVYVQPLAGGPKRQVSIGGGQMPIWNRNGSELFYAARDGMLMSVTLRFAADRLEIAEPQSLFPLRLAVSGEIQFPRHPYDVSPDGQKFLVIRRAPDTEADGAVVVTNWTAVLGRAR